MSYFKLLDDKSIVKLKKLVVLDPYFWYDSLIIIWGEMGYFKVLDDKSIVKAVLDYFGPYFLVRFPYNYLGKNELF